MKKGLRLKLVLFIILVLVGFFFLYPSIRVWSDTTVSKEDHLVRLNNSFPYSIWKGPDRIPLLNLGLDLVGGMHLVLEADTAGREFTASEAKAATNNAINIIRNRVDEIGVAEPNIQRVGNNRIQVQLPGVADRERALDLIGKTGLLEFRLVGDTLLSYKVFNDLDRYHAGDTLLLDSMYIDTARYGIRPFSSYLIGIESDYAIEAEDYEEVAKLIDEAKPVIPDYIEILFGPEEELVRQGRKTGTMIRKVYLIEEKAHIVGANIRDAGAQPYQGQETDYQGTWIVDMELKQNGQTQFAQVTGDNVGRRLAIVFDNVVMSAPVIKERIPPGSHAQITTRDRVGDETKDLAILISHGALPIPLRIAEERTVSPTLGRDSVRSGVVAILVGLAAVVLFMLVYYTGAGAVAIVTLIFNLYILLAGLAGFRTTLTLPGLAGIALTIGMAVDANVLIYERIRDELSAGKFPRSAVETGYGKAWKVILDANITTIMTVIILLTGLGSGPVRGFAVTLIFGLIINMITAIYFSRGLFDAYLYRRPDRKLFI
ncbi:protein translocase subunit SecD [candidate division WOR-3 bacterium]|uniref:Protein translocase subunit SecD n=1 Tax=candidate division WOR-3 bacterium TaxID=2052148 RepID=A0A9D5K7V8_UNCW3|nr:protein translocase subunit SecD [candidate division WOR-3 bacterium]MBD3363923.1 protein translocase subunit SecD [candidate division WOR-3 bacterium]